MSDKIYGLKTRDMDEVRRTVDFLLSIDGPHPDRVITVKVKKSRVDNEPFHFAIPFIIIQSELK